MNIKEKSHAFRCGVYDRCDPNTNGSIHNCPFSKEAQKELFDDWMRGWSHANDILEPIMIKYNEARKILIDKL